MISAERHFGLDLLYLLFRWPVRIGLVAALFVACGVGFDLWEGPNYTARVHLVVPPGPDGGGRAARDQAELLRDPGLVQRVMPALMSRRPLVPSAILQRYAARFPEPLRGWMLPAQNEAGFAARVGQALSVRNVGDTDVLELSFDWGDPVFAAEALNVLVAGYERSGTEGNEARDAVHQAELRLAGAEAELAGVDRRLLEVPAGADSDGMRAERERLEARLSEARETADHVRLDRALAQKKLDTMEQAFRTGAWVDGADAEAGGAAPLAAGFTALLEKRQALLEAGHADSAEMRALDREMARARTQSFATARQIAAARVGGLDDRLASLAGSITDNEAALRGLDRHASEAEVLGEARKSKSAQVEAARRGLAEASARLAAFVQAGGTAKVVSAAMPPLVADWPGPWATVRIAAMLGLVAGVGSAAWAEARRRTIDRASDIGRRLGVDVLARLDKMHMTALR